MSVEQQTILQLQQQLHDENKRRFEQIEKRQDKQDELLEKILANTADLPDLKKKVDEHDSSIDQAKGIGAVAVLLIGGLDGLFHLFLRRNG